MKKLFLILLLALLLLPSWASVSAQATAEGGHISTGGCILGQGEDGEDDGYGFTLKDGKKVKYCVEFEEPIPIGDGRQIRSVAGNSGVDVFAAYVSLIYKFGAIAIGLVCVLIIVVSGIQIIAGGASPDAVSQAKTRITQALFSLILLFSAAMILRTINPNFFG